jgi:RimJ/RimL family protein N-acetyltransferase
MDEALKCVINLGFQKTGLEAIEAYTHKENTGSIHLLERNDFKLVQTELTTQMQITLFRVYQDDSISSNICT